MAIEFPPPTDGLDLSASLFREWYDVEFFPRFPTLSDFGRRGRLSRQEIINLLIEIRGEEFREELRTDFLLYAKQLDYTAENLTNGN